MIKVVINTSEREYFHKLLAIFRGFKPFKDLPQRTIDVFAELLYFYNKCEDKDPDAKMKYVMNNITDICKYLNISKSVFYNQIYILRKYNIIVYKAPADKYRLKFTDEINIKFVIE